MLFDTIFLSLFFAGWLLCAYVPWVSYSIATRGNAGMAMLPLCLMTGLVFALAVPVLGFNGKGGLMVSFPMAFAGSALILGVRRFTLPVRQDVPQPAEQPATPGTPAEQRYEHR